MAINSATLSQELSRLVVEAFVQIGLSQRDVLGGAIVHTDLPWQVPPLVVEAPLFGASLSEYFDRPTYVSADSLLTMFSDVLSDMRNDPRRVLTLDGYRAMAQALPSMRTCDRLMRFSIPDGYPGPVSDFAGVTFALECAHVMRTNTKIVGFVSDDDNYYADLGDGTLVGIKDGLPTMWSEQWDIPVVGMVQELLRNPRGAVWEGCDYNVISQARSVATIWQKSLREFEAIDWALQALRVIGGERDLLRVFRNMNNVAFERSSRMAALQDAVRVSRASAMTDRQRIEALKNLLVPGVISAPEFTRLIYSFYRIVPPVVHPKVLDRIQRAVDSLLEQEEMLYARLTPQP